MPPIHVMSDALASQVAAGEVIERPASVVKELIENSLDAGARELRVEIQRGGVALTRVTDDGCGMNREDAVLSLERHATSKLREKEDLAKIRTLGFRGEALPSIASVARFRLTTRETGTVEGTEVLIDGGKLRDVREAGCPPGTVVEVRDLFFNIPARRKFLRTETTEAAHIDHQVRLHALACPGVRVVHRKDGRTALDVAGSEDRRVRIGDLFGRGLLPKLREIERLEHSGIAASGYLLPVEDARKSRRGQYLFLNGRPVEDRVVWRALEEGFRGALAAGRHPVAWMWIEMDPHLVDVNVHPAKREVRFHRPAELRALILEAVERTLRKREAARPPASLPSEGARMDEAGKPTRSEGENAGEPAPSRDHTEHEGGGESPGGAGEEADAPPASSEAPTEADRSRSHDERAEAHPRPWQAEVQPELESKEATPGQAASAPSFRVVGVLESRYVILEASDGLVLMEGEAARERILYEAFLGGSQQGGLESQGLLVPALLELEARDADLVLRNADNFREAGMEVESFGGITIQLRSVPALLSERDPKALLLDLVDEMVATTESRAGRTLAFEKFAGELAAVGARGERCRSDSARGLLDQLFACDLPYCTPDGRPTLVQFSYSELRRRFGKAS